MNSHEDMSLYEQERLLSGVSDYAYTTAHEYQWNFGGERFMDADELKIYEALMKESSIAYEQQSAFYARHSAAIKRHEAVLNLQRQKLLEAEEAKAKEASQ